MSYKRTLGANTPRGSQQLEIKQIDTLPQTMTRFYT